jgi:putative endonuclease
MANFTQSGTVNLPGTADNLLKIILKCLMTYFVYILRTSSDTLYIGQTNNLEKRIMEHKSKSSKSAKYIRYFDSFELIYSEKYLTRKEAMQREVQLKKWTRVKKEALIKRNLEL